MALGLWLGWGGVVGRVCALGDVACTNVGGGGGNVTTNPPGGWGVQWCGAV